MSDDKLSVPYQESTGPGFEQPNTESTSYLDLAFAMDCTGSMGSYIYQAQQNIRSIVEEIFAAEKSDVHLALVEYRDHPPQDSSFVTRVHDFTSSVSKMKTWLDDCSASGGGDNPEAVADALHEVLKLNWRDVATKICVLIADAPPHGLGGGGDGFPNGCPDNLDPMQICRQLAEKNITIYMVGCEPSITPYKDFFMAVTHITGGQYVPLGQATLLSKVIIGGAQEEMSLQVLMDKVNEEVKKEVANKTAKDINEEMLSVKVFSKLATDGVRTKSLQMNKASLPAATSEAKSIAEYNNLEEVRKNYRIPMMGSSFYSDGRGKAASTRLYTDSAPMEKGGATLFSAPMSDSFEKGGGMLFSAPAAPRSVPQSYDVVEQSIDMYQAQRLVKKSLAKNSKK